MTNLVLLSSTNLSRFEHAHITRHGDFEHYGALAFKNKQRYINIVHRLQKLGSNMPDEAWCFIAAIHYRESTMNFNTHLGQGDPLTNHEGVPIKTVHVPAGRGPFPNPENPRLLADDAFEQAAVDALWYCAPYAAKVNKDWTIGGQLTFLERYNGLAYANVHTARYPNGAPSPYLWSGTDQYISGKVMVDHGPIVWSVVDKQVGVAGLLLEMDRLDDTIDFGSIEAPSIVPNLDELVHEPTPGVHDAVWVQWVLNQLGTSPKLKQDGIVGDGTKAATRAFQFSHHLKMIDGRAGTIETIPAMVKALHDAGLPEFPAVENKEEAAPVA